MKSSHQQLEFTALLAEVPDSTVAVRRRKRERARALAKLRREEKRAELALWMDWADWYETQGSIQLHSDEFTAAIESFQRAMELDPRRTGLRDQMAFCYLCLEEFNSAQDLLIDLLRDEPDKAPAYLTLAAYYTCVGPNDEMVKRLLGRALEIDPGFSSAHIQLGNIANREGRKEDALAHFEAMLRGCPDCARSHYMRVTLYLEQNRYTEAGKAFDQMLENADLSDPANAELFEELKRSFSMESAFIGWSSFFDRR